MSEAALSDDLERGAAHPGGHISLLRPAPDATLERETELCRAYNQRTGQQVMFC